MFEIRKAIVKIDADEYAKGFWMYPGYIDASQTMRDPNEERITGEYETLEEAEKAIDRTVTLDYDDKKEEFVIEYEYIVGAEDVHFNKVLFECEYEYDLESDFFVADKSFSDVVIKKLEELDLWGEELEEE